MTPMYYPQAGRLVRLLEYTDTAQRNEAQTHQSPTAISPPLKYSRSLGDVVTPKLKSMSTPSTPATDVSFELPPENFVLQGRVSSFSMYDGNDNPLLNELESQSQYQYLIQWVEISLLMMPMEKFLMMRMIGNMVKLVH